MGKIGLKQKMSNVLYFAYGSCMSPEDLKYTVKASLYGVGHLHDHRLAFTRYAGFRKSGVADVVEHSGEKVEGLLLKVPSYWRLDGREGHPYIYKRSKVEVYLPNENRNIEAYTYKVVDKLDFEVAPNLEYSSLLLQSAHKHLSKEYYNKLATKIADLQDNNIYEIPIFEDSLLW